MKKTIRGLLVSILFIAVCEGYTSRGIVVVSTGFTGAGAGKIVDLLAEQADIVVRSQGESHGHRVVKGDAHGHRLEKGREFKLTLIPSGILRKNTQCYLTAGMEIDPSQLCSEINLLMSKGKNVEGRLWISARAHVVMPYHRKLDALMAQQYRGGIDVGSRKGVGVAAADKRLRIGIRIADLLDSERFKQVLRDDLNCANAMLTKVFGEKSFEFDDIYNLYQEYARRLRPYVKGDVELEINKLLIQGKAIIFEGAHGTFLDISMGTYPYVSSSSTTAAGICTGAGVGPRRIGHTIGIVQSYTTYIGSGPLPAEIKDPKALSALRNAHKLHCEELPGTRYGWIDLVMIRQAILINGIDSLVMSKLDELDGLDEIKICYDYIIDGKNYDYVPANIADVRKIVPRYITMPGWKTKTSNVKKFSQLPQEARAFVKKIECLSNAPVSYVSVGPEREQTIKLNDLLPL